MKNVFVETANVKAYHSALSALEERGAEEACIVVVDGAPGLGKTTTMKQHIAQTGSIYLRAKKEWQPKWMLNELLDELGVEKPRGIEQKYAKVVSELALRQQLAIQNRKIFTLVIDEFDHCSSRPAILETCRDISDMLELPTIFVGMGKVNDNLKRFPQVASRVSQKVRFDVMDKEDVRRLIDKRCEIRVADDLVTFVAKMSKGYNREVLEAIASIERFGFRIDVGEDGITMADMAGEKLMNDRASGTAIIVPEVL
ncbi:ATP-binding protein [Martelella lutilitoris]|uniref:ATP-binding protein n=1 Tax=Martelella lutilitoris TaxID=2583532 RepID=A0A7T7KJV2_9HYPH|nr:ATP-binding protein [Martelella lutilitoris]QQM29075.1 ATP-binding protein [Martelella lutilitoris]